MTTIAGIKEHPDAAKMDIRAETRLEEDVRCSAKVRDFPGMVIDEPPGLGGGDAGPNPVELVLVALGTCQEIIYSAYAAVMGVPLDSVKVSLQGKLDLRGLLAMDPAIPPGYQSISYRTELDSPADAETLRTLVETVENHCPILDTLTRAIDVKGSVNLNGKPLKAEAIGA
jgi:uncharacterized OsmC-like protein